MNTKSADQRSGFVQLAKRVLLTSDNPGSNLVNGNCILAIENQQKIKSLNEKCDITKHF